MQLAPSSLSCSVVFFSFIARSNYDFSFFSRFKKFIMWSVRTVKSAIRQIDIFLLSITRSDCLAEIRWCVCISKSQRISHVSFSRTDSGMCIYHLFIWSNLNFKRNSKSITLVILSCPAFYSFCDNLLHLLIMWLIVSSLSSHKLHLLFCCVLSILAWSS